MASNHEIKSKIKNFLASQISFSETSAMGEITTETLSVPAAINKLLGLLHHYCTVGSLNFFGHQKSGDDSNFHDLARDLERKHKTLLKIVLEETQYEEVAGTPTREDILDVQALGETLQGIQTTLKKRSNTTLANKILEAYQATGISQQHTLA